MGESAVGSVQSPEYDQLLKLLRQTREEASVSQRELSRRLGKASSYVGKIEAGTRRLDVVELIRLLRVLELDLTSFLHEYINSLSPHN
ncbi:MAG: helix-turn-helix domain-containing protein [Fimbriimonadaceae bacterium]